MIQEAAKSASMIKPELVCDGAKSNTGKPTTKRSDGVKNCVKLIGFVAVTVLVLQCGAQQLQASRLPVQPTETTRVQSTCCSGIDDVNGTDSLLVNSIDRHDREPDDKPHSNGHSLPGAARGQWQQESNVTSTDELSVQPTQPTATKSEEVEKRASDRTSDDKLVDLSTGSSQSLATMAPSGVILLPASFGDPHLTLDQLAMIHTNIDSNPVELATTVAEHPSTSSQEATPSATVLKELQTVSAASMNQPSLAELTVEGTRAGLLAAQDLVAAQANNNYDRQVDGGDSSEEGDDDSSLSSTPDFNNGQVDQERADLDEHSNNALQQRFSPVMQQPMERAPKVYQDNTPRHLDAGNSLTQEQSGESPEKASEDEAAIINEQQMPDSIESLMRSGGETGVVDADEQSAADEPTDNESSQGQQQSAAGNNYAQNAELPGYENQNALLAGGANPNQDPAALYGIGSQGSTGALPQVSADEGDDDQGSDDYDDGGENKAIISPSSLYNQQVSFQDKGFPAQLTSSTGQPLLSDSTHSGPVLQDYLQTAAGHYYGKKKKVKKVKKVKVVKVKKKKKKKKHYKVIKYKKKKKKKGKKHVDHGKYYMYAKVPKKKAWEFGFKKGNKKHWIERHEKGHKNKFKTKVKWYDKKSKGKGIHIWDYNHHDKKKKHHR